MQINVYDSVYFWAMHLKLGELESNYQHQGIYPVLGIIKIFLTKNQNQKNQKNVLNHPVQWYKQADGWMGGWIELNYTLSFYKNQ